ncbi:hypothetical protein QJQ45_022267 [Haematococcus lacustris]|nr:hypothetical protein QJQ45_022267 [Haematococcus lacustris]
MSSALARVASSQGSLLQRQPTREFFSPAVVWAMQVGATAMRLVQQHQLLPASVAGFVEACALALQEYAAQHGTRFGVLSDLESLVSSEDGDDSEWQSLPNSGASTPRGLARPVDPTSHPPPTTYTPLPSPTLSPPATVPGVAAFFEAVTLNVQGLTHPHKFQAILDWAADSPAHVFFLQECHRAECVWQWAESATGAKPCWRGLWFYTPGTGHSQGCLALFKPSTILVGCSQVHLQVAGAQGRVLRVDAELAGRPASLVCVYAPAQASQRATFFSSCLPACLPLASERRLVIMGGDFNCILSPEDKVGTPRGGNTAHPVGWLGSRGQGAQQLQELVTERGLVDAWRHLRPGTRDFTHFSTPWQTGGRLDRWYIPAELVEWQLDSSILGLKPVHTDHAAVSLAVCPPNLPLTAPAPWQLHPAYLDDPDMMDRLQSFLLREAASHAAQMSNLPSPLPRDLHRARWAHIKQGLALHAQRCIRDRRRAQRALQQARERAAHAARTHLVQQLLEVEQLREAALQAAVVVGEATALVGVTDRAEAAQRSMQASAVLDQVYGDSSSFYSYHRHQSAHTPTLITSLHLPDLPDQVADLTTTHGVQAACHAFQSHFSAASPLGVYAAKPVVPAARATLLASLTSRLTPTQADSSEGPGGDPMLSEEELGRALQGCAHSKAPGKDGLPMEVYDRLWPLLRPPLMAMLREALADTSSPAPLAEFLTGLVTLVPKAGKPRDQVTGYRPITLLNCDVRLVARALEDRLQRPLDLLVSPSQSAFILGRDIGDNVQFHLSLLEYLRQRGSPAWLLLLDLAGAYDNVSWDLLQATMEAMGFRQDGHVRGPAAAAAGGQASPALTWGRNQQGHVKPSPAQPSPALLSHPAAPSEVAPIVPSFTRVESRWRPLELCYWPDQGALPAKGKEYPGLGYKRLRDKPPKAQQQQQQQPAEAQ